VLAIIAALGLLWVGGSAQAATRSMVASLGVINPSVVAPNFWERGPLMVGRGVGVYAPDQVAGTVDVAGATTGTSVGRQITLAANKLDMIGFQFRDFAAFPTVAQVSFYYATTQAAATFANGGGALAQCPGDGCTASGAGTAISWCPPLFQPGGPNSPIPGAAPGTVSDPVGNWDCPGWFAPGTGNRVIKMTISNSSGRPNFGGSMRLLQDVQGYVWRVKQQPAPPDSIAVVTRSHMFDYEPFTDAKLNTAGAVTQTLGCQNPAASATVGPTFVPGAPQPGTVDGQNLGYNCGTPGKTSMSAGQGTLRRTPGGQGWDFPMTTGTVSGSDPWPFLTQMTASFTVMTPQGAVESGVPVWPFPASPFNVAVHVKTSYGFFFTRMGTDLITSGGARNIVMLGGGVANDPSSGNAFFRITDLRMTLVPEPATGLALVAGVAGLVAIARRRF
jgi:hypothetical protein